MLHHIPVFPSANQSVKHPTQDTVLSTQAFSCIWTMQQSEHKTFQANQVCREKSIDVSWAAPSVESLHSRPRKDLLALPVDPPIGPQLLKLQRHRSSLLALASRSHTVPRRLWSQAFLHPIANLISSQSKHLHMGPQLQTLVFFFLFSPLNANHW